MRITLEQSIMSPFVFFGLSRKSTIFFKPFVVHMSICGATYIPVLDFW